MNHATRLDPLLPTSWLTAAERRTAYRHFNPIEEAHERIADTLDHADRLAATLVAERAGKAGVAG